MPLNLNYLKAILSQERYLVLFLLAWIILGFMAGLDYTEVYGCVIDPQDFWGVKNIILSSISFFTIFLLSRTNNFFYKKCLIAFEITYWIVKLIIFKEGYMVGFGGTPSIFTVLYDLIALALRLLLFAQFWKSFLLSTRRISILTLLIIGLKVFLFATPISAQYVNFKNIQQVQELKKEIVGKWKGEIKSTKKNNSSKESIVIISENYFHFKKSTFIKGKYDFSLDYANQGSLINHKEKKGFNFIIQNYSRDSLLIRLSNFEEQYLLDLKRKN